ncbi:hypothetical protein C8R46DRAFT_1220440 [Mycena filopes]|nr:hypothetical protein C8R46DRAFT_1220440 [Mycena filopes]
MPRTPKRRTLRAVTDGLRRSPRLLKLSTDRSQTCDEEPRLQVRNEVARLPVQPVPPAPMPPVSEDTLRDVEECLDAAFTVVHICRFCMARYYGAEIQFGRPPPPPFIGATLDQLAAHLSIVHTMVWTSTPQLLPDVVWERGI